MYDMNDIVFPVKILNVVSVDLTITMEGTINRSLDTKSGMIKP